MHSVQYSTKEILLPSVVSMIKRKILTKMLLDIKVSVLRLFFLDNENVYLLKQVHIHLDLIDKQQEISLIILTDIAYLDQISRTYTS